jgi:diphthamide synthase (EF-2-diphthine--ammonia ligase)
MPVTAGVNCAAWPVTGDDSSTSGATWSYQSTDGGVFHALTGVLYAPPGSGPLPAVVVSHGKGGSAGSYSSHIARAMRDAFQTLRQQGMAAMAFGDLFLADVREYRERLVRDTGVEAVFPIWGRATGSLARQFVRDGFRAVLVCVDPRQIDVSHCGAEFDDVLLDALPATADPCGENGEFHTFVYDGPMFDRPIGARRGEVVERGGFVFCDLLLSDAAAASSVEAVRGGMPSA